MVDWSVPITTQRMYGEWELDDASIDGILDRSRDPTPATALHDLVGELGVGAGDRLLDIGGRDASHGLQLAERHGCRVTSVDPSGPNLARARQLVAAHPSARLVDVVGGRIEAIPAADDAFDAVWCRDVLTHVADLDRALGECRRVLRPGGPMIVYQTVATPWLEPREEARLTSGLAVAVGGLSLGRFEGAVERAGFTVERAEVVGSQWREAWEEDGSGRTSRQLLHAARLIRLEDDLRRELGTDLYKVELANALWGVYQMIGKLAPHLHVLRPPGAGRPPKEPTGGG
jgi:SAM-dependent methyltransferase